MCCFSGRVTSVSGTKIFARCAGDRQFLVYELSLDAPSEVAMILPLPVAEDGSDPISFIDLSGYPEFFKDMAKGFPLPRSTLRCCPVSASPRRPRLEVVHVGSFEASFVPSLADFDRVDERFKIAPEVWTKMPEYRDYSFVVFKFKAGQQNIHPMAFSFATRAPGQLYFPTVHVHDGKWHRKADFDHELYCQADSKPSGCRSSSSQASAVMQMNHALRGDCTRGTVAGDQLFYRRDIVGEHPNEDIWMPERPKRSFMKNLTSWFK